MSALVETFPGMALLLVGLALVGAALGLVVEYAWDEWQSARKWREVDHLARVERAFGRRPPARRGRRGRRWESAWGGVGRGRAEAPVPALGRPRS